MIGSIAQHTLIHVVLSVIGIVAGLVATGGLISGRRLDGWIGTFIVTTFLTNLTGFGFPIVKVLPSHIVGGLGLALAPVIVWARYKAQLAGGWRRVFVVAGVLSLYLNVFVLVTQLFAKVPGMIALAPTQKEWPFAATHLLMLVVFVLLGRAADRGFRA